jgi:hypothetical protein
MGWHPDGFDGGAREAHTYTCGLNKVVVRAATRATRKGHSVIVFISDVPRVPRERATV